MLARTISKNSIVLTVFAFCTAGMIAVIQINTKDRIHTEQRKAQEKALIDIIPKSRHNNDMLDDTIPVDNQELLGLTQTEQIYIARQNGEAIAVILPAQASDSYSGEPIKMIVGINRDGTLAGVRVLFHKETPGLGDKINTKKSNWIYSFDGKSLANPEPNQWKVKKDKGYFDQFTGATITPRAVVRSVYQSLKYFKEHKETLFAPKTQNTLVLNQ